MPAPATARTLSTTPTPKATLPLLSWGAVAAMVGAVTALVGTYWDDAWHTDVGRDTFWSPPHLVLYAGVALFTVGVVLWTLLAYRQAGSVRGVLGERALLLALLGAAVTMASAPVDDFWHHAFGRDAVLWSPPHMAGVAGIFTLAAGALLWVSRIPGQAGRRLTLLGTAAVLATLLAVIFEYESDVPQFSVVWYLPILSGAATLAFALGQSTGRDAWIATKAALVYTGLMTGVVAFLAALGHSNTLIPVIALPAVIFDLCTRFRLPRPVHAAAFSAAIFAAYVPYLNLVLGGVQLAADDVFLGLPLAFAVTLVMMIVALPKSASARRLRAAPGLIAILLVGLGASPGYAHDPGQGKEVATMRLRAFAGNGEARVVGTLIDAEECAAFEAAGLVARRAGRTVRAPLSGTAVCQYAGSILLPERGRWFVYVELNAQAERVEAWIPVIVSAQSQRTERVMSVYRPPVGRHERLQVIAGVGLYALNLLLVGAVITMFRRRPRGERRDAAVDREPPSSGFGV